MAKQCCGRESRDGDNYCGLCGSRLNSLAKRPISSEDEVARQFVMLQQACEAMLAVRVNAATHVVDTKSLAVAQDKARAALSGSEADWRGPSPMKGLWGKFRDQLDRNVMASREACEDVQSLAEIKPIEMSESEKKQWQEMQQFQDKMMCRMQDFQAEIQCTPSPVRSFAVNEERLAKHSVHAIPQKGIEEVSAMAFDMETLKREGVIEEVSAPESDGVSVWCLVYRAGFTIRYVRDLCVKRPTLSVTRAAVLSALTQQMPRLASLHKSIEAAARFTGPVMMTYNGVEVPVDSVSVEVGLADASEMPEELEHRVDEFAVGDQVGLKEPIKGGPSVMYVEAILESGDVRCRWTKPSGLVERGEFGAERLEHAEDG